MARNTPVIIIQATSAIITYPIAVNAARLSVIGAPPRGVPRAELGALKLVQANSTCRLNLREVTTKSARRRPPRVIRLHLPHGQTDTEPRLELLSINPVVPGQRSLALDKRERDQWLVILNEGSSGSRSQWATRSGLAFHFFRCRAAPSPRLILCGQRHRWQAVQDNATDILHRAHESSATCASTDIGGDDVGSLYQSCQPRPSQFCVGA